MWLKYYNILHMRSHLLSLLLVLLLLVSLCFLLAIHSISTSAKITFLLVSLPIRHLALLRTIPCFLALGALIQVASIPSVLWLVAKIAPVSHRGLCDCRGGCGFGMS